jgi:uncharacterized membrane protein
MTDTFRRHAVRVWALLFAASSLAIAVHAFAYFSQDFNPSNPFHVSFAAAGWAVPVHFFGAGLALLLAPLQLSGGLRARWPALHRVGGWLYVLAVLAGGVSGIALAPQAQGGWAVGASFMLLALLWLLATGLAVFHALRGRHPEHRRWMLRSVAMTFAAATLRLYLGLGTAALGLPFASAYLAAAWLCWPVNLLLIEIYLRRAPQPRLQPRRGGGKRSAFLPAGA